MTVNRREGDRVYKCASTPLGNQHASTVLYCTVRLGVGHYEYYTQGAHIYMPVGTMRAWGSRTPKVHMDGDTLYLVPSHGGVVM